MRYSLLPFGVLLLAGTLLCGCATTGTTTSSSDPLVNTASETYRKVRELDDSLADSISQLQSATDRLSGRLESANDEVGQLEALIAQNQRSLSQLRLRVEALRRIMNAELGLSGPRAPGGEKAAPPEGIRLSGTEGQGGPGEAEAMPGGGIVAASQGNALALYDAAQQAYVREDYAKARDVYSRFLREHPDSVYADSAQYWMADANLKLAQKHSNASAYQAAAQGFEQLVASYPDSPKVPRAIYRQAVARLALGQTLQAAELLERVVSSYPDTVAAQSARSELESLKGSMG